MENYEKFMRDIKDITGIDLLQYKEGQMKRRLTTLRDKKGFDTFQGYVKHLKQDEEAMIEFLDRITINVSEFFRNLERWNILKDKILPEMIKKRGKIKCWSAACSTGEEPYTLAIILKQFFKDQDIDIVATDIDQNVINKAKEGIYNKNSVKNVSDRLLKQHFEKKNEFEYTINDSIKDLVRFKKQDLLNDRFEQGYDLIICRNVTIYFTEEAKEKLYRKFSDSLNQGGIFFVGSTEQIFKPENYKLGSNETFFYEKK